VIPGMESIVGQNPKLGDWYPTSHDRSMVVSHEGIHHFRTKSDCNTKSAHLSEKVIPF
jgi:hypothetical protein